MVTIALITKAYSRHKQTNVSPCIPKPYVLYLYIKYCCCYTCGYVDICDLTLSKAHNITLCVVDMFGSFSVSIVDIKKC